MNLRTVKDHIVKLVAKQQINQLDPYDAIRDVLINMKDEPFLKPIKDALPGKISYNQIKL